MKKILLIGVGLLFLSSYTNATKSHLTTDQNIDNGNTSLHPSVLSALYEREKIIFEIKNHAEENPRDIHADMLPLTTESANSNVIPEFKLEDTTNDIQVVISSVSQPSNIRITGSELQSDTIFDYMNNNIQNLLENLCEISGTIPNHPANHDKVFLQYILMTVKNHEMDALEKYHTAIHNFRESFTNYSEIELPERLKNIAKNLIIHHKLKIMAQWIETYIIAKFGSLESFES